MILNNTLVGAQAFEKHLISRKRKKSWGKKAAIFTLMLTSMVDMFSMLVVFLLQTFSSSPEILVNKGVVLPDSITSTQVIEAPVLAIASDGHMYLDQKMVGETKTVLKSPNELMKKLNSIKEHWGELHAGVPFPGEVNLQADKDIPSTTVSQVMGILTNGEFQAIQLAVIGLK